MLTARRLHYSYADYLDVERHSDVRHEYFDGEIYAMAGGTPEHSFLASQLATLLAAQLPVGCRVGNSDLKIRVDATGVTTYPDLSIVCGKPERFSLDEHAVTNPALLAEVTSPSTQDYDRGEKLAQYKQIPSLRSIWLIAHDKHIITLVSRTPNGEWLAQDHAAGTTVQLDSPRISIVVDALYAVLEGL